MAAIHQIRLIDACEPLHGSQASFLQPKLYGHFQIYAVLHEHDTPVVQRTSFLSPLFRFQLLHMSGFWTMFLLKDHDLMIYLRVIPDFFFRFVWGGH